MTQEISDLACRQISATNNRWQPLLLRWLASQTSTPPRLGNVTPAAAEPRWLQRPTVEDGVWPWSQTQRSFVRERRLRAPAHHRSPRRETDRIVHADTGAGADYCDYATNQPKQRVHQSQKHYAQ